MTAAHPPRHRTPFARQLGLALGFLAAVTILTLWLAGAFHRKIEPAAALAGGHPPPDAAPGRPVGDARLVAVLRVLTPRTEAAVGSIRAVHESAVAAKLLAKVIAVSVKAGQPVRRDEILVQLDDSDLRARLQQADAAIAAAEAGERQARIEFDRLADLIRQNSASRLEFDRAGAALKAASADLERVRRARDEAATILEYTVIRSPIDGVVIDKRVEAGDTARPGQTLVTLYDPTRMQLVASVRESLTHRLKIDQTVAVRVDALGRTCEGRVSEIVPEAASASRTFSVKVTGPCPPGIYSGMFGRLLIPLDDESLLAIPAAAVRRIGQLDVVDVADGGFLRRRAIQIGRTLDDGLVQVLSGLRAGEQVRVPAPSGSPATSTAEAGA